MKKEVYKKLAISPRMPNGDPMVFNEEDGNYYSPEGDYFYDVELGEFFSKGSVIDSDSDSYDYIDPICSEGLAAEDYEDFVVGSRQEIDINSDTIFDFRGDFNENLYASAGFNESRTEDSRSSGPDPFVDFLIFYAEDGEFDGF